MQQQGLQPNMITVITAPVAIRPIRVRWAEAAGDAAAGTPAHVIISLQLVDELRRRDLSLTVLGYLAAGTPS